MMLGLHPLSMDINKLVHPHGPKELPTPPPDARTPSGHHLASGSADSGMGMDIDAVPTAEEESRPVSPRSIGAVNSQLFAQREAEDSLHRNHCLEDFQLVKTLGTGTFARVWAVRPRNPADKTPLYALKQLKKADIIRLKQSAHVRNERNILALCRQYRFPFITQFLGSWQDPCSLYILLEYSPGGELFTYLRRSKRFQPHVARFYAAEITLIWQFLHAHGIVYRDLKPENILLNARGHVTLVDFGFAKVVGNRETYTLCGTPEYLSPEVIQSRGHSTAVDWWALGILLYEMHCGFPPFYDNSPFAIYEKIVEGRISFPAWLPEETKDIIRRLCSRDLSMRLGNLKGGARDVMEHPFFAGVPWEELAAQKGLGPIVPRLRGEMDTSAFEDYAPPARQIEEYDDKMREKYDAEFRDF